MKITRELLRLWGARYDDERIAALVPEEGLTPLEVADLDIPEEGRLWVLLREEVVPARELRLLACGWAEAACVKVGCNDERSLKAIAVGRRHAVGEATEDELAAAWTEAWSSARSARSLSARSSVRSLWAAALSARSSVRSSVRESVRESAWWSAFWAWAASAATRAEQLADVVRALKQIAGREGREGGEGMKTAIARARAATAKAKRQRDNWKRRAEEAEARMLEVELAMEVLLPKIKAARWKAMNLNAGKAGKWAK